MESTTSEGGPETSVRVEKKGWANRIVFDAPISGWLFLLFMTAMAISFVVTTWNDYGVRNIDDAVTFLSVCAQVNATVAGFLLVGLLFLVQKRSFTFRPKRWFIQYFDIAVLGVATAILVINAFECLSSILYAMGQDAVNQEIAADVTLAIFFSKLSYIIIIIGLWSTIGFSKGRVDSESERREGKSPLREETGTHVGANENLADQCTPKQS